MTAFYEKKAAQQLVFGILEEPIQEGYATERQDLLSQIPESGLDTIREDVKLIKENKLSNYRELSFTSTVEKPNDVDFNVVSLLNLDSSKNL